jgi:hypothetical protein
MEKWNELYVVAVDGSFNEPVQPSTNAVGEMRRLRNGGGMNGVWGPFALESQADAFARAIRNDDLSSELEATQLDVSQIDWSGLPE